MKKNLMILIGSFSMSIPMNLMILSDLQVLLIQAFLQTLMDANAFLLIQAVPRTRLLSLKEKKLSALPYSCSPFQPASHN
jgi:hypothetical protein